MKYDKISLDTLFSAWVFIWFIVYYFRFPIPLLNYWNPAASLILALSYQILTIFVAFLSPGVNLVKVLPKILLITFLFKAGPLYLISTDIPWLNSIISGAVLFAVYYAYIYSKVLSVEGIYNTLTEIIIRDEISKRITIV